MLIPFMAIDKRYLWISCFRVLVCHTTFVSGCTLSVLFLQEHGRVCTRYPGYRTTIVVEQSVQSGERSRPSPLRMSFLSSIFHMRPCTGASLRVPISFPALVLPSLPSVFLAILFSIHVLQNIGLAFATAENGQMRKAEEAV